jgi:hypothetical protein
MESGMSLSTGKAVVITGSGRGIGAACAKARLAGARSSTPSMPGQPTGTSPAA